MTDQLEAIVLDVRAATRRDVTSRRHSGRRLLGAVTALAMSGGVAAAAGGLSSLADLFDRNDRILQVTTAADGSQHAVLDLVNQASGGGQMRAKVTDRGVTRQAQAVPGASVCETDGAGILSCGGVVEGNAANFGSAPTIPSGTRVYRIEPEGASGSAESVMHIPSRRLELIIVGSLPGTPDAVPSVPPGSTEQGP